MTPPNSILRKKVREVNSLLNFRVKSVSEYLDCMIMCLIDVWNCLLCEIEFLCELRRFACEEEIGILIISPRRAALT